MPLSVPPAAHAAPAFPTSTANRTAWPPAGFSSLRSRVLRFGVGMAVAATLIVLAVPAARRAGVGLDGLAFADAWRGMYQPSMEEVRSGRRPFAPLDVLHRVGMLADFGLNFDARQKSQMLLRLNKWLLERYLKGGTAVLIVDEAQNLAPDVLEQVRMISNLETERDKLIQIILAGIELLDHLPELTLDAGGFGSLGGDSGVDVGAWTNKIGNLEGIANLATTTAGVGTAVFSTGIDSPVKVA